MNLNQITLPAKNVGESADFYRRMGFTQIVQSAPKYARFECTEGGATFSLHHVDRMPGDGWVIYFECENVDSRVGELKDQGFEFRQDPRDETWLWREARLKDPSGNEVCLYHAGTNRRFPPWRV